MMSEKLHLCASSRFEHSLSAVKEKKKTSLVLLPACCQTRADPIVKNPASGDRRPAGLCLTAAPNVREETFFHENLTQGIFKGWFHYYYKHDSSIKQQQRHDWSIEDVNQN